MNVPRHIAIIMDGNGRWAAERALPRWEGHREGAKRVRPVVEYCIDRGVKALTLYAFSVQNWGRPKDEIGTLMGLLTQFIALEKPHLIQKGVRVQAIGDLERLPQDAEHSMRTLVAETAENTRFTLNICLSYGGREEIVRAMKRVALKVRAGELRPEDITEESVEENLDTFFQRHDPDLVIRTSGEQRLSNFLLWQSAYAELWFTEVLWPDFNTSDLEEALGSFASRERRYGLVKPTNGNKE